MPTRFFARGLRIFGEIQALEQLPDTSPGDIGLGEGMGAYLSAWAASPAVPRKRFDRHFHGALLLMPMLKIALAGGVATQLAVPPGKQQG